MNQTLIRTRLHSRQSDDASTLSSSSSSGSTQKLANSFVASINVKNISLFGIKLKSSASFDNNNNNGKFEGKRSDDITVDSLQYQQQSSENTEQSDKSSRNTIVSPHPAEMECSPNPPVAPPLQTSNPPATSAVIKVNEVAIETCCTSTTSSVTLSSSSSLIITTSNMHILNPSYISTSTTSTAMDVEDTNKKSSSVINANISSTSKPNDNVPKKSDDVNERVEALVQKVLSSDAIKVVNYIASKIDEISKENLKLHGSIYDTKTLLFCGRKEPTVTLHAFMLRLVTLLNWVFDKGNHDTKGLNSAGIRYLIMSVIYIERAMKLNPDLLIVPLNIHRILLGATMNAMTFYEDIIPEKSILARIGGVDEKQIRILGARFFQCLDWRLWINQEEFIQQYKIVCDPLGINFEPEVPSWQM